MTQAPRPSQRGPSRSPRRGNPLVRLALLVGCVISAIILGGVVVAVELPGQSGRRDRKRSGGL